MSAIDTFYIGKDLLFYSDLASATKGVCWIILDVRALIAAADLIREQEEQEGGW